MFVLLFSLLFKSDDDETDENVHHEKRNNDNEGEKEKGHCRTIIVDWPFVSICRVDCHIQKSRKRRSEADQTNQLTK